MEPLELFGDLQILRAEPDGEQHVRTGEFCPALLRGSYQDHFSVRKLSLELLCSGWRKIRKTAESRRGGERNTHFGHDGPLSDLSYVIVTLSEAKGLTHIYEILHLRFRMT